MDQILRGLDFGNEAADDVDPNELASYFVEQAAFGNFIAQRKKFGSPQEFDCTRILGCFLEDHKFGPGGGHALSLQ